MSSYDYIGIRGAPRFYDVKDKERNARLKVSRMLSRSVRMFEYKGLPETIPARSLELILQTRGYVVWTNKYNGEDWFVYQASLGGVPNQLYMPTLAIVANPAQRYNAELEIDKDCVVMPSDSMYLGLVPEYERFAAALVENEISMNCADVWARLPLLISAGDDRTKASAEQMIERLMDGDFSVVGESQIFEGLKVQGGDNARSAAVLTDLIEYEQYMLASWFHFIGLNSNYNMKREAINSTEAGLNLDALRPLVDDMLIQRRDALAKVEEMGGPHIEVELASAWKEPAEAAERTEDEDGEDYADSDENATETQERGDNDERDADAD